MQNNELLELISEISGTNAKKCMLCGKCSARCPHFNEFDIKPHQFVNMIAKGNLELFDTKTIHMCLTCMECVERCPRGVAPANLINAIKEIAIRTGENFISANDINTLIDDDAPQQLLVSAFRKYSR